MPSKRRKSPPPTRETVAPRVAVSSAFHRTRARNVWFLAALLSAVVLLTYANTLHAPFIVDDYVTIVDNPDITDLSNISAVLFPGRDLPASGRPLVNLTFAINYALDGVNVLGYHVANVAVHVLCAIALFGFLRRTFELPALRDRVGAQSTELAVAAAAIWALHPLNSEVVNYTTQRTESMFALFFFLTLYASVRSLHVNGGSTKQDPPYVRSLGVHGGSTKQGSHTWWQVASVACCALGMLCKESMVTAPVIVILFDRCLVFDSFKDAFARRRWLYAGLAATWVLLAGLVWSGPRVHSAGFSTDVTVWTYLLNQTVMITRYLRLALWPDALVVNYGWPLPLTIRDVVPQGLLVLALLAGTIVALIRWPRLGLVGAWFFVTLAPTSSIVPIATEVGAERRMYVPLVAMVVVGVLAAPALWRRVITQGPQTLRRRGAVLGFATLGLVVTVLSATTFARNREYASALTLAQTVVDRWPTGVAHHVLGDQLIAAGRNEEGIAHLRRATADAPRAHYSLGVALLTQGKAEEGIAQLQEFIRRQPLLIEVVSAHVWLGRTFVQQQRWSEAVEQARLAIMKDARDGDARALLAEALYRQERFDEAIPAYRALLALRPTAIHAYASLGIALVATERLDAAIQVFERAVEVDPRNGEARRNLATALMDRGDAAAAAVHAREAIALRPNDPVVYDLLGQALARQGQFDAARAQFESALRLDPANAEASDHLARVRGR